MRRTIPPTQVCTVVLGLLVFGCDSGPAEPSGPGELEVTLASTNTDDAAAVIELTGTGLGQITNTSGELFTHRDANTVHIVILLDDPGEIAFRIAVDDVGLEPSATVVEVADGDNQLRASLGDYRLTFEPIVPVAASQRGAQ